MLGFSAKFAFDLIDFAVRNGARSEDLNAELDLAPEFLSREDVRVSAAKMARVWKKAHAQTGQRYLALGMGQAEYSAQQSTSLIMKNSVTVREAFDQATVYGELIANVMAVQTVSDEAFTSLVFTLRPLWQEEADAVTLDCLLIAMISAAKSIPLLTGVTAYPEFISLNRASLSEMDYLEDAFGCPISIRADRNAIVFSDDILARKVIQPNPALRAAIKAYADEICGSISLNNSIAEEVRRIMIRALPNRLGQARIADQLSMSVRTLQRRLRNEGVVYRALADAIHTETAHHHLATSSRSLQEIAFLSGYSDAASMIRAYKRRYGALPKRIRPAAG